MSSGVGMDDSPDRRKVPGDDRHLDAALADLYAGSADRLFRFLLARCGSRELAEDLTSTAFEQAALAQVRGRGVELSEAWLFTVARRRLTDHWRAVERDRRRVDRLRGRCRTEPHPEPSEVVFVDTPALRALARLPMSQRTAISLRYLDGLTVGEVAERLSRSYRSTESLLARGRRGLTANLQAA